MDKQFFTDLELMLAGGQFDLLAKEILTNIDDNLLGENKSTLLLLSSQYNKINKDFLLNLVDYKEFSIQHSRITLAFTNVIADTKTLWLADQEKAPETPAVSAAPLTGQPKFYPSFLNEPNVLRSMDWLKATLQAAQSVCHILIPKQGSMSTGVLIANGWVATNHHVLPTIEIAAESIARFFFEAPEQEQDVPILSMKFSTEGFYTDKEANFTLVRLQDDEEMDKIQKIPRLRLVTDAPSVGDLVSLVHHPLGGPKKIDLRASIKSISPDRIVYNAASQPGSSGGAVFNEANDLLGLHTGRNPDYTKYFIPVALFRNVLADKGIWG